MNKRILILASAICLMGSSAVMAENLNPNCIAGCLSYSKTPSLPADYQCKLNWPFDQRLGSCVSTEQPYLKNTTKTHVSYTTDHCGNVTAHSYSERN